ncbi:MAG: transporter, family, putative family transporter protein [Gaiellales bacterium]|nr:transporter, family, putative family transporter protein [Gaiellales bacterium]
MRRLTLFVSLVVSLDLAMYSAIVPLLPDFADRHDLSKVQSGLLFGGFSAAVLLFAVPVGHLADRIGCKIVTVVGSVLMAAATAGFALSETYPLLLTTRIAQGIASAIVWSAALAWLAESTPEDRRGTEIGFANAAATAGLVAGPLLGGVVASAVGVREAFLGAAVLSLGLAWWGLTQRDAPTSPSRERSFRPALRAAASEPMIAASLLVITLVAVVGGTLQVLMPLHLGADDVSQTSIGWLYSAGAVIGAVAIAATGRIGDRVGRPTVALIDCVVLAALLLILLAPLGTVPFAVMLVIASPVMSVLYGIGYPLGADGADAAGLGHGLVMGIVNLVWGIGAVIGPIVGPAIGGSAGDSTAYVLLAVLSLLTAAALRVPGRVRRPLGRPSEECL